MKKILYFSLLISLSFTACKDEFLDRPPLNSVSEDTFWKTENDVYMAVNAIYATMPSEGFIYDDGSSDIAHAQYGHESSATAVSSGSISTSLNAGWSYVDKRKANYFLANIDKAMMDETLKNRFKAEVRFIRALSYFNMVNKFGDVPLVTTVLAANEKDLNVPRTPKAEVVAFILKELDEVEKILPVTYSGGRPNEKGRITKGAVLTLKSRIYLNEGRFSEAAAVAKEVMGLGYSLFKISSESDLDKKDNYSQFVDFADKTEENIFRLGLRSYESLFYAANKGNNEVILDYQNIKNSQTNGFNLYLPEGGAGGWSSVTPTQNLVDAYQSFKSGDRVIPPSKEERAARYANSNKSEFVKEFRNRDPRFYATILFETAPWNAYMLAGGYTFSWSAGNSNMSRTGYNFRKFVDPDANRENLDNYSNVILMRYAEVLLTYAEAQNEVSGPDGSIFDALNQIRDRAGMPRLDANKFSSQESLRAAIREERVVELALEGFRYMDIRRWKTASEVMKNIYNVKGDLAQERVWDNKLYLMPVPQSQIDLSYGVLKQNPGY